jgi:hypothetical protein
LNRYLPQMLDLREVVRRLQKLHQQLEQREDGDARSLTFLGIQLGDCPRGASFIASALFAL